MEINNQTRSKVSKPNKLGVEKKLLGNTRYFPMQLIERWLTSFVGCLRSVISSCSGHSLIKGCVGLAALPFL